MAVCAKSASRLLLLFEGVVLHVDCHFFSWFFCPASWASEEECFPGGGAAGDFPKFFSRGGQNGEIWFLPLKIEKQPFFANNLKILGGLCPPFRRPCPALFLLFGKVLITFDQLVVQLSCECSWLSRLSFQLLGLLELGVHCSV